MVDSVAHLKVAEIGNWNPLMDEGLEAGSASGVEVGSGSCRFNPEPRKLDLARTF